MSDDDRRINNIVSRLNSLTLEANTLTRELKTLTSRQASTAAQTPTRAPARLKKGDKVAITNNYKGQIGTTGTVIHLTAKQVTIKNETTGKQYIRKFTNVKLVKETQENGL
jgi:hypothetical protein